MQTMQPAYNFSSFHFNHGSRRVGQAALLCKWRHSRLNIPKIHEAAHARCKRFESLAFKCSDVFTVMPKNVCKIISRGQYFLCSTYSSYGWGGGCEQNTVWAPPELWRRPPGWPHSTWLKNINDDLTLFDTQLPEQRDAAQNWPFWRMLASYSAKHP